MNLQLASGQWFILSGFPYELGIAYEIFVTEGYRPPERLEKSLVSRIVDVGSNVGYSIVYWATHFPQARIEGFEPHPAHLDKLRRSITLNDFADRVTVHGVAAGTAKSLGELADRGPASAMTAEGQTSGTVKHNVVPIEVVDFFETVGESTIDLLKLDCEGGEFDLLMDPRFARLDVRNLVMEWHETPAHPEAERDLTERLSELGWEVEARPELSTGPLSGTELMRAGLIWAFPASSERQLGQSFTLAT
ncbi:MAG TPA: FkbM family methyltransferase [Candidatus Binataceae bacterium]|nr:FkbM family methyltransferase [Candidatus Binataceae bacterium]